MKTNPTWPVLTRYDQDHLLRIALPLGGIGTGTVSLGGRGDLRDWEIVNRPAKGFTPDRCFFALYAKESGREPVARALEGAIEPERYEGHSGSACRNHSLPRFRHCEFHAAYPFGQVVLSDPDLPLDARIEAFNPLIPGDASASGIPVAVLRFVLTNKRSKPVAASVCGTVENFIGFDGSNGAPNLNVNLFRTSGRPVKLSGLFMHSQGVDPNAEQYGTMALAALARSGVTCCSAWKPLRWNCDLLEFWDDFSADGQLEESAAAPADSPSAPGAKVAPRGSLAVRVQVPPRGQKAVTFLLAWRFPNRMTWTPEKDAPACSCGPNPNRIGNYYATQYRDAWDVVEKTAAALPKLEAASIAFVRSFCDSGLPHAVKEAALFNLAPLRSQTSFRTEDGLFYGWEGCRDQHGCCHGSCTHVWNYEQATAFLFGDLSRMMREIEFLHATDDEGRMSFRVNLPLSRARQFGLAAADGQMGCLMKLYRDWRLSGDDSMLRRVWPHARKALEFCWIEGGWDADRDGVMEGCQHNTMDVEYYGPNPEIGAWYLGALRAGEEMARRVGETEFADQCRRLFDRGSRWMDDNLFNGEYYEHRIQPISAEKVAPGLRHPKMGARDLSDPDFQLGAGCLADQLVGQYMADVCGLGPLLNEDHIRKTLASIMKYNFKDSLSGHFNNMRSYALNDESALLVATYPRGSRPKHPFPYFAEAWTGLEYTAAAGMLYAGQTAAGLKCIEAVRARHDGKKRNPFDEPECGHHYARAMASWAAVLALTGFRYSGVEQSIEFAAQNGTQFWSNGSAWGTCGQKSGKGAVNIELRVLHGTLNLKRFALKDVGEVTFRTPKTIRAGKTLNLALKK